MIPESTAPPPRMPVSVIPRYEDPDSPVIPGYSRIQEKKPEAPSIGQMLLAKDGWLQKHKDENISLVGQASSNRGGLGYSSAAKSMIIEGDNFLKKWNCFLSNIYAAHLVSLNDTVNFMSVFSNSDENEYCTPPQFLQVVHRYGIYLQF